MTVLDAPGPSPAAGAGDPARVTSRGSSALVLVAGAAAIVPIVVAMVRAWRHEWYPIGDNAYFALRARDVLTEHHPLLGTWTSASLSIGEDVNNPGPLLFDLFAPLARLWPERGVMVGASLLNIGSVVGMALVARRLGDTVRVVAVLTAAAALVWVMGSELVVDPWQPHALMLPFLFFLVVVWNLVEGDRTMLPVAVGLGCLLVQTHLSYAINVAVLGLLGVAGMLRYAWAGTHGWAARWRAVQGPVLVAAGVALVLWAQPLAEQVQEPRGNLTRVAASVGSGGEAVGPRIGARIVANAVVTPPSWWRPAFGDPFPPVKDFRPDDPRSIGGLPPTALAATALIALLIALGVVAWGRRRSDRSAAAAATVALVAVVTALVTTSILPMSPVGFGSHQVRWLWPVGVFATMALVLGAAGRRRAAAAGLTIVAVVLGIWALPAHVQETGWLPDRHAMAPMRDLAAQLEAADIEGPVLFASEDLRRLRIFEPFSTPTMLELERGGIDVVVDDPAILTRQLGEERLEPESARARMVLVLGPDAEGPAGARRVAYAPGLDDGEQAELERLTRLVDAGAASEDEAARQAMLRSRWQRYSVAAYLVPVEGEEP